jgi:hypothetical protein
MSDDDILFNLQSLSYNIQTDCIEQQLLNLRTVIGRLESWSTPSRAQSRQSKYFAIVTVVNTQGMKHAILLHSSRASHGVQ